MRSVDNVDEAREAGRLLQTPVGLPVGRPVGRPVSSRHSAPLRSDPPVLTQSPEKRHLFRGVSLIPASRRPITLGVGPINRVSANHFSSGFHGPIQAWVAEFFVTSR